MITDIGFQKVKFDEIVQYLRDKQCPNLQIQRNENLSVVMVIIEDIRSAYEMYLKHINTEGILLLPMKKKYENDESAMIKLFSDALSEKKPKANESVDTSTPNILKTLNEECMLKIFSYLNLAELFEVSSVCSDFRAIVRKMKKIKNIDRIDLRFCDDCFDANGKINQSVGKMKNILYCIGDYIQEIRISADPHWNEFYIFNTMIQNVGKNLRILRLSNFRWLPILFEYINSTVFQQIKTLYLLQKYSNDIPIPIDIKTKFPKLEKLELHGKWILTNFSNWTTVDNLTLDRFISLNHTSWMSWMENVSSNFSNLYSLKVWKLVNHSDLLPINDEVNNYECLTKLTKLRKIQITVFNQQCFENLIKMSHLSLMSLIFYKPIREIVEDKFFQLATYLKNLTQLELILEKDGYILSEDLIKYISLAYNLNSLHLKNITRQTIRIGMDFLQERKKSQIEHGHIIKLKAAFGNCCIDVKVIKVCRFLQFTNLLLTRNSYFDRNLRKKLSGITSH